MKTRNIPSRALCVFLLLAGTAVTSHAAGKVVISQVYGGGGNSGATYKNDFVELFNSGDTAVSLAGWSVQYASAAGTSWQVTNLSGSIAPGHFYLVQEAAGAGGTTSLPTPDATGSIPMSATAGKVALVSSTTALVGACPTGAIDLVGFSTGSGGASCFEGGAAAPTLSNTTADIRVGSGCTDNDKNSADFAALAPTPRNSANAPAVCLSLTGVAQPEGNSGTTAFNFVASLNIAAQATVSFNASTADVSANAGSDYMALTNAPFAIAAGQTATTVTVLVDGDVTVEPDETFTVTLSNLSGASPVVTPLAATGTIQNDDAASITLSFTPTTLPGGTEGVAYSQSISVTNGTACSFGNTGALPAGLSLQFSGADNAVTLSGTPTFAGTANFTLTATCSNGSTSQAYSVATAFACESGVKTSTAIHTIQGSGATSAMAGQTAEVEGIVVGVFNSGGQFGGYYLQEPDGTWDADVTTSEGIFIHDSAALTPAIGDRVRVRGVVTEFASSGSSLTELDGVTSELACSTGNSFTRSIVELPTAAAGDLERYEGMAVQVNQQLIVTGNFDLGAFGQIDLSPQVLFQPTQSADQSTWAAQTNLNARSILALDDGSTVANANLYPTAYPQGGLSASNTLRTGALVNYEADSHLNSPLVGILDDRFGSWRIQPTSAVTFYEANPRPDIAPLLSAVGGRFRAVSANVLNFFTTLNKRGAATAAEFDHQKTKVVEALFAMAGDLYGLSEVQNYANGNASGDAYTNVALQSIVTGLNCKASGLSPLCATPTVTPYNFIDTTPLGTANGTDAIRSAIVYKPAVLTPVGNPAAYYQNDTNRPTLAQTFRPTNGAKAAQQTFTFVVNHWRSRSSACGLPSDDANQGNCNGLRLNMSTNVAAWLATNPTADPAAAARRILMVGDYNAYYGEDPIQYLVSQGYTNLINGIVGAKGYSYNFGSTSGYIDHAFANAAANKLVKSMAEWHNNADEPAALQALDSSTKSVAAQAAYYSPDPWAASDHDPFFIGFNTLPGDLNDDGVVDSADQALLNAAIGKPASQVDRRMDYDGDSKITLNDYRVWVTYYQAYRQ